MQYQLKVINLSDKKFCHKYALKSIAEKQNDKQINL